MKAFPKNLAGIDVIWQLNDPVLVTEKVFNFLKERSHTAGVPFVTSLSEEFANAGAMAAVSVDFTSLGAQSATIAREILNGKKPQQVGVQAPIGAYLALNLDVAEQLGKQPDPEALANVNKVFSTAAKQAAKEAAEAAKKTVAVVDDKAAEEARRKAQEEALRQEEVRRQEEAKRIDEARRQDEEEARKKEEALKAEEAALKKLKKQELAKKKEELEKKKQELEKQKEEAKKKVALAKQKEEQRKKEEADKIAAASKQPGGETGKPSGRLVVFYDPDANHEAILQISSWFTKFLQAIDPEMKLQPVRSIGAYESLQKKGQVAFAILPSSYVRTQLKRGSIVPLLIPSKGNSVDYQKVLFAKSKDTKPKTLAVTSGGASTKELTAALKSAGIPVDGVTVIPVSKDVDALLALVFGQVDAAVVKLESLEVVKTIQPQAAATLQRLQETRPITRPPFVAMSGVSAEDQAKVVAAMKAMNKNASGARAMRSLGVDAWVTFEASMLK
jgi:ABC-type phosphate/phosphonate transport system substrate-binding protein